MTRALIIGAGITGPVTAMALQKAGIDATVYEAYDRTADGVGAYLNVAVNGLAALQVLDIDPNSLGGFDTPHLELCDAKGKPLARLPIGRATEDGLVSQTILRSDLYVGLRDEATKRGIDIQWGKRLAKATTRADGTVVAEFTDGTVAEGDLLIGADGLNSPTRALINEDCPTPRYTGLLNTGGYAHGIDVDGEQGVFRMVFGKRAFFAYVKRGPGEVWWFANVPRTEQATDAELAELAPRWREELNRLFADDDIPALDIIAHTEDIAPPWNTCDMPKVPTWHRGSIILIGDAAHAISPTSGQGASLAIEDGIVLAKCLRDAPSVPAAFAAFEQARRTRVEKLIAQAKRTSDHKIPNAFSRLIRDKIIMPLVARAANRATKDWVHDYRLDWDSPVAGAARSAA
ncbi:FAD-dependent monooxygenase [Saccharomonospora sp. NPDC006951]